MKRIVILIDGTWDKEGTTGNTNVAKLGVNALIKRRAANGTVQQVRYHDGVALMATYSRKSLVAPSASGSRKLYWIATASLSVIMKPVMRFTFSGSRAARTQHAR